MRRSTQLFLILLAFELLIPGSVLPAEPGRDKAVAANRALHERYRSRYETLAQGGPKRTPAQTRELADLRYKIQALDEDLVRLRSPRPPDEPVDAQSFLRQVIGRQSAAQRAPASPGTREDKIAKLHELALERVSQNDLLTAIQVYEEIILEDGTDDQAYLLMGHCLLLSGMYEKAENAFFHAVELVPRNHAEIIPFYENAVIKYPDDDAAHSDLGYAWLMLGDYLKAKEAFRDALDINPQSQAARDGLGLVRERGN